ncbi:hypothetical protein DXG01_000146 [Tephrocybe rancida]|nr:hypothetical protein DXG01_000146 [Tephrocybe rancida]
MAPTQIIVESPWLEIGCALGEGPLYDSRTFTLHFVDIIEKRVFHLDTRNLDLQIEQFDGSVTCLALRKDNPGVRVHLGSRLLSKFASQLACAAAAGFAILEGNSSLKYISEPFSADIVAHTRFNDGGCDSKGRFFAGTIYSKDQGVPGLLYRYDPNNNTCVVVDEGPFTVGTDEFYFTDSLNNKIYAYDYDDGNLSNRRVFVDAIALGMPENTFCDGLCVDTEGGVWSARLGFVSRKLRRNVS